MMQCIEPTDDRYFAETSDELYDRHHYMIVSSNGESITVDDWESCRYIWFNKRKSLSHVDVIDVKKQSKGFN